MISADVLRGLAVAGYPVAEPCAACGRRPDPTVEALLSWLVQHRIREVAVEIGPDGAWAATARWPGPDADLRATGQSAADALAKIVLEIAAR